jgi:hypoxanthine phosphoribosyltransferase
LPVDKKSFKNPNINFFSMKEIIQNNSDKVTLSEPRILQRLKNFTYPEVDCVVGIQTGGSQPAAMISKILKVPLIYIYINFRASDHTPRYENPQFREIDLIPDGIRNVLLVDDVSVSGKTLDLAKSHLNDYIVYTLVLKGQADYVIFPEIRNCVQWPWSGL